MVQPEEKRAMRKVKLDIGELVVESFATAGNETGTGTVKAHESDDSLLTNCFACAGGGSGEDYCVDGGGGGGDGATWGYRCKTCSCNPQTCVSTCYETCTPSLCPDTYSCPYGNTCYATCAGRPGPC